MSYISRPLAPLCKGVALFFDKNLIRRTRISVIDPPVEEWSRLSTMQPGLHLTNWNWFFEVHTWNHIKFWGCQSYSPGSKNRKKLDAWMTFGTSSSAGYWRSVRMVLIWRLTRHGYTLPKRFQISNRAFSSHETSSSLKNQVSLLNSDNRC